MCSPEAQAWLLEYIEAGIPTGDYVQRHTAGALFLTAEKQRALHFATYLAAMKYREELVTRGYDQASFSITATTVLDSHEMPLFHTPLGYDNTPLGTSHQMPLEFLSYDEE